MASDAQGRGLGVHLLTWLQEASINAGFWTLTAKILKENQASIALHERCGFRIVGFHDRLGLMIHWPHLGPVAGYCADGMAHTRWGLTGTSKTAKA